MCNWTALVYVLLLVHILLLLICADSSTYSPYAAPLENGFMSKLKRGFGGMFNYAHQQQPPSLAQLQPQRPAVAVLPTHGVSNAGTPNEGARSLETRGDPPPVRRRGSDEGEREMRVGAESPRATMRPRSRRGLLDAE